MNAHELQQRFAAMNALINTPSYKPTLPTHNETDIFPIETKQVLNTIPYEPTHPIKMDKGTETDPMIAFPTVDVGISTLVDIKVALPAKSLDHSDERLDILIEKIKKTMDGLILIDPNDISDNSIPLNNAIKSALIEICTQEIPLKKNDDIICRVHYKNKSYIFSIKTNPSSNLFTNSKKCKKYFTKVTEKDFYRMKDDK